MRKTTTLWTLGLLICGGLASCASSAAKPARTPGETTPASAPEPVPVHTEAAASTPAPAAELREVFPFVRVEALTRTVEFDGWVPIDAHNAKTPRVYLELIACTVDSREHEALIVTKAKASNIHAALLLAGLTPGTPGVWNWDTTPTGSILRATPPTGPRVRVRVIYEKDGTTIENDPRTWVRLVKEDRTLADAMPGEGFLFAGSRFVSRKVPRAAINAKGENPEPGQMKEYYHADVEGTLIGLTTFGMEMIAWTTMWSPDAATQTPDWIARAESVPAVNTPVRVRITPEP